MRTFSKSMPKLSLGAVAFSLLLTPLAGLAQRASLEEIVVTGTRKAGQSPTETLSPVDLIGGELLGEQAAFDLTDGLPKLSPSLNTQRFPIADGTAFIRPVTLRNLSPDHTLVLMNGTRRHRSALVNLQVGPAGHGQPGIAGRRLRGVSRRCHRAGRDPARRRLGAVRLGCDRGRDQRHPEGRERRWLSLGAIR